MIPLPHGFHLRVMVLPLALALPLALPLALAIGGPAQAQEAAPALTVTVATVEMRQVERMLRGDGSIVAWQELVIGAEAGGLRVAETLVEEGDAVAQGQLLVRLDDAVPRAQAAQARAAVAEAEANLRVAGSELRRAQELQRSEYAARQTLEQRQATSAGAEARLASARAAQQEAEARLAQTRILAPTAGTVTRRSALPGAVVAVGQEMLRMIREDRIELDARVPELDLSEIAPGQAVRVLHGDRRVEARVRAVAPTVGAENRLGIVHIALPADAGLRPGMFARAEIVAGHAEAPSVPREAVLYRDSRPIAFVLQGDRVALRRLELGAGDAADRIEIRGGLAVGDRVVVAGAGFLSDGMRVRLADPAMVSNAGAPLPTASRP